MKLKRRMVTLLLLIAAAFAAGAINSVAGGGSFLTFPSLVFSGVAPVMANASNTVALVPGTAASVYAYRGDVLRVGEPMNAVEIFNSECSWITWSCFPIYISFIIVNHIFSKL